MRPASQSHRTARASFVVAATALMVLSACTAFEVMDDRKTDYVPRHQPGDRVYEVAVRVVGPTGTAVDGVHTRLRGVRYLNGERDLPQDEFYLFGLSGDSGEPGLLRFRFPGPVETTALDLYVLVTDPRRVRDTHYYPGRWWDLKWLHNDPAYAANATARVDVPVEGG